LGPGGGGGGGRCLGGQQRSMWRARWDPGVLKAEALALLPCGLGMAFSQSHVIAARRHPHSRLIIEVDEYSSNPTQAFTFYNINQGRFQPPHVQMVDPVPHDAPKPPGYTRFVCVSDTHSRTDPIQMPYGDVLIHAGDFTELGLPSEVKKFNEWLGRCWAGGGLALLPGEALLDLPLCHTSTSPTPAPVSAVTCLCDSFGLGDALPKGFCSGLFMSTGVSSPRCLVQVACPTSTRS